MLTRGRESYRQTPTTGPAFPVTVVCSVLDKLCGLSGDWPSEPSPAVDVREQIWLYLVQLNIPCQQLATTWWRDHAAMFPDVAAIAQRYLSAPATSVPSKRCSARLLPERAEQLLFIKQPPCCRWMSCVCIFCTSNWAWYASLQLQIWPILQRTPLGEASLRASHLSYESCSFTL